MTTNSQITSPGRSISQESIGLKISIIVRTSQFSSSDRIRPLRKIGIKRRHQRDREQRHADQGEGLREGQRVEQLPLASREGEDRQEREDRDQDREEDRAGPPCGRRG